MAERSNRATGRRPWVLTSIWGWRLEVAMAVSVFVAVRLSVLLGPGGPVLVVGSGVVTLWRFPGLRRRGSDLLRQAALRRSLERAFLSCDLYSPDGRLPQVRSVEIVPSGRRYRVRIPLGCQAPWLVEASETLAAALQAREVRVVRDPANAALATVVVVRRDPFAGAGLTWPWLEAPRTSIWQPVPIGVDEDGHPVCISLPEHNLLLGGEPGAGKSAALSLLLAACALDPGVTLTLMDGKQVELAPWSGCAKQFVGPDMDRAVGALAQLCTDMDIRYVQLLQSGRRKIEPGDGLGLHVVVIDELALYLRSGTRAQRTEVAESLRDLVSRGRAAGMIVLAATQKPGHEIIPTWIRDLFSFRLALRCTTPEASDTVLGQGWAAQGYSASAIDPAARGVGLLLAEGGLPAKLRTHYLDDQAIAAIAARATELRSRR